MMITWREREHEEKNMIALNDPGTVRALRDYGLLKYFCFSRLRKKIYLLEFLVRAWDTTIKAFHIREKVVPITVDVVYFYYRLVEERISYFPLKVYSQRRDCERLFFAILLSRARANK